MTSIHIISEERKVPLAFMESTAQSLLHLNEDWPKWVLGLANKIHELEAEVERLKRG